MAKLVRSREGGRAFVLLERGEFRPEGEGVVSMYEDELEAIKWIQDKKARNVIVNLKFNVFPQASISLITGEAYEKLKKSQAPVQREAHQMELF